MKKILWPASLSLSLSYNKEAEINQAFISTSTWLDDLLNIANCYFKGMVGRIYPHQQQLNNTEAQFLAHLSTKRSIFLYSLCATVLLHCHFCAVSSAYR